MSKDTQFQVPDDIKKLSKELHEAKIKKDKEDLRRKYEENLARKKSIRSRVKAGLPYAKKIFEWTSQFRKSDVGQKMLRVGDSYIENGIFFYDAKLEGMHWRGLGVSSSGIWWHHSGCGARPMPVRTPKELAETVESEILKASCNEIETGTVWETIRRRMKDTKYLKY